MNKMNRRSISAWAVLLAAGWLMGGCSDSPQRQAGRNLRQEAAESQRAVEKALTLLGNPAYGDSAGNYLPLRPPMPGDPDQVRVYPPQAVNPNALKCLSAKALDEAIKANPDAEAPEKNLALAQAGRVYELRPGDSYHPYVLQLGY